MSEIIKVDGLVKRYKELIAVDNFSMTVNEGEILGLLGPNGSGKSTLVKGILGLKKYSSGSFHQTPLIDGIRIIIKAGFCITGILTIFF